jgi:UrcA family protein
MNSKNITLAIAAAAVLPTLALAADPVETQLIGSKAPAPSVVVRFGDLNLSTPQGLKALNERLSTAAWQVCTDVVPNPVSIEGGKCRTQLIEAAKADINNPDLR